MVRGLTAALRARESVDVQGGALGRRGARARDPPNPGANRKSISHRCHPILVAKLTKEIIDLPLGCLQGGARPPCSPQISSRRGSHR